MTELVSSRKIDTLPNRGDVAFHEIAYLAGCAGCTRAVGAVISGGRTVRDRVRANLAEVSALTGIPVTIVNGSGVRVIGEVSDACSAGNCIGEDVMELFTDVEGKSAI